MYPVLLIAQVVMAVIYLLVSILAIVGAYLNAKLFNFPPCPEFWAIVVALILVIGAIVFIVTAKMPC